MIVEPMIFKDSQTRRVHTWKLVVLGLWIGLLGDVMAAPPGINTSVAIRREHPCLTEVISVVRTALEQLHASGGTIRIDSIESLERLLKQSGVTPAAAIEIQKLFDQFKNKEIKLKSVERLLKWMQNFKNEEAPPDTQTPPPALRILICMADKHCSLYHRPTSHAIFPFPLQMLVLAPAPELTQVGPIGFLTNLLGTIGFGYAQSRFGAWLEAIHLLRHQGRRFSDPLYESYVQPDGDAGYLYSTTLAQFIMHFESKLIQAELFEYFYGQAEPEFVRRNWAHLAQVGFDELGRLHNGQDAGEIAASLGLVSPEHFFRIAKEVGEQIEHTIQTSIIGLN